MDVRSALEQRWFLILVLLLAVSVPAYTLADQQLNQKSFAERIAACSDTSPEARFSCYRAVMESFYGDHPQTILNVDGAHLPFDGDGDYAVYGTNCHTYHHALGDFLAVNLANGDIPAQSVKGEQRYCPTTCTSGCIMGYGNRMAMIQNFSTDWLKRFYEGCRDAEKSTCAHEIGHVLADKHIYSHLELVDSTSQERYGLEPTFDYNYVSFEDGSAFGSAFAECDEIVEGEDHQRECYTGIGHNQFIYAEFGDGFEDIFDKCDEQGASADCYKFLLFRIGINEGATAFIRGDTESGNQVCSDAVDAAEQEDIAYLCHQGIGGGIGLYIESTYMASGDPTENATQQFKDTLMDLARLCEQSDDPDECYTGLLGTKFKGLYKDLDLDHEPIENILDDIDEENIDNVVG